MRTLTLCLLLLVAGSACLLKTNANEANINIASSGGSQSLLDELLDNLDKLAVVVDDDFNTDYVEPEEFGIFKGFKRVLRTALRTLKGINCTIKEVMVVKEAAARFSAAVNSCGIAIPKDIARILKSCQSIIATCNDIINLNDNLCNNADFNEQTDADKQPSHQCFVKLLQALLKLRNQIKQTLKLIKKLPADTDQCFRTATDNLQTTLVQFPSNILECSHLTS